MQEDYLKVATSAANRYSQNIQQNDLMECIYDGISDAILTHNPEKGKITSHIYNRVTYNCKNYIRKNHKKITKNDFDEIVEQTYETRFDPAFTNILIDRYVYKLPIDFIAEKYNLTIDEAKVKIKNRKRILKRLVLAQKLLKK